MLKKRIIPVVLLKNGWIVQSRNFNTYQNLGNPTNTVKRLMEWCSDEIIYLDITKNKKYDLRREDQNYPNRKNFKQILKDISKIAFVPITVGGNIKNISDIEYYLYNGADKISINSQSLIDNKLILQASKYFGSQSIVLSIDAKKIKNEYYVYNHIINKVTNIKVVDWIEYNTARGAGEIFLNSVDNDGKGNGFDLALIYKTKKICKVPLIICGGAGKEKHFKDAIIKTNIDALAAANFFHYKDQSVFFLKKYLTDYKFNFRSPDLI